MIKLPKYDIWPILKRVDFPGGYFDAKGGVHWMLTDAIGSIEMVVDSRGSVEQHTGYYPYGEPWRNPAGQPYLFGAKERRSYASLNDYDFHARFYTAANTLWHAPDSHAGKYHHLSPWTFCAANPIRYSDPTGKDAMFTVEGNNITVTANIFIHGDLATKELAQQYQDDIYAKWGSVKEYEHDGTTYNVIWDVRVKVMDKNDTKVRNGINNYMKVTEDEKSKVGDSWSGFIRSKDIKDNNPMSHEFGHMLGISDKYGKEKGTENYRKPISPEWIGDVMAEPAKRSVHISKGTLNILFKNVLDIHTGTANFNNNIRTLHLFPKVHTTIELRNNVNREPKNLYR